MSNNEHQRAAPQDRFENFVRLFGGLASHGDLLASSIAQTSDPVAPVLDAELLKQAAILNDGKFGRFRHGHTLETAAAIALLRDEDDITVERVRRLTTFTEEFQAITLNDLRHYGLFVPSVHHTNSDLLVNGAVTPAMRLAAESSDGFPDLHEQMQKLLPQLDALR